MDEEEDGGSTRGEEVEEVNMCDGMQMDGERFYLFVLTGCLTLIGQLS